MATILHEVWMSIDEHGQELHACILAGSLGQKARELLREENAKLIYCFQAETHFEAMTKYHKKVYDEIYKNPEAHPTDFEPYAEAWANIQVTEGLILKDNVDKS